MGIDVMKQRLIELIQQGDEQYIRVMTAVSDALNETDDFDVEAYEASLKPMTREELINRALESERAIESGEVYDIDVLLE